MKSRACLRGLKVSIGAVLLAGLCLVACGSGDSGDSGDSAPASCDTGAHLPCRRGLLVGHPLLDRQMHQDFMCAEGKRLYNQ